MQKIIDKIVEEKMKSSEIIKRARGIVTELLDDGYRAKVSINDNVLTFLNKTGEELSERDEVTIHYWTNISNGYIAVRHGRSNPLKGQYHINDAIVVDNNGIYDYAQNLHGINAKNKTEKVYGSHTKDLYLNGYPIKYLPTNVYQDMVDTNSSHDIFKSFVNNTPNENFYKEIILKSTLRKDFYGDTESHDVRYYMSINSQARTDSGWNRTYGLYSDDPDVYWHYANVYNGKVLDDTPIRGIDDTSEDSLYHSPTFQGLRSIELESKKYSSSETFADSDIGFALYHDGDLKIAEANSLYAEIRITIVMKIGTDIFYKLLTGNFVSEPEYNFARSLKEIRETSII